MTYLKAPSGVGHLPFIVAAFTSYTSTCGTEVNPIMPSVYTENSTFAMNINLYAMKTFLKMLLAVILGMFLFFFLSFFFFAMLGAALMPSDKEKKKITSTVLSIDLSEPIVDRATSMDFSNPLAFINVDRKPKRSHELLDVLRALDYACEDAGIEGIYIDATSNAISLTIMEELRPVLEKFKAAGKYIYVYGPSYTQGSYSFASLADSVIINPAGEIGISGLSATLLYKKDFYQMLGLKPQVIRHGKFKSAVEPYMSSEISPENRLQTERMLQSYWGYMLEGIEKGKQIDANRVNAFANERVMVSGVEAVGLGFADVALYRDQVDSLLRVRSGQTDEEKKLKLTSLREYVQYASSKRTKELREPRIGVLYAQGVIDRSGKKDGGIGSSAFVKEIRELRQDEKIKAVVFRVNSPGGDAFASEEIWRELHLLRAEKPLIVSMGDYAASGGYYIACPADRIFCNRTTLTGSIGVYGLIFSGEELLKSKLKINPQVVRTHAHADMGYPTREMTNDETAIMQRYVEETYDLFTRRVADGRNMTQAAVDSIGQGRVWGGDDALEIGLVDEIGGLQLAIEAAAKAAELDKYQIREFPVKESKFFDQFMEKAFEELSLFAPRLLPKFVEKEVNEVERALSQQGVRAELPAEIAIQ